MCIRDRLVSAAPGMDNIYNEMLQNCPLIFLDKILELYNDIWNSGNLPQQWKTSKILPILKPDKRKEEIESYWPVALTSCLGKLLERMVNNLSLIHI